MEHTTWCKQCKQHHTDYQVRPKIECRTMVWCDICKQHHRGWLITPHGVQWLDAPTTQTQWLTNLRPCLTPEHADKHLRQELLNDPTRAEWLHAFVTHHHIAIGLLYWLYHTTPNHTLCFYPIPSLITATTLPEIIHRAPHAQIPSTQRCLKWLWGITPKLIQTNTDWLRYCIDAIVTYPAQTTPFIIQQLKQTVQTVGKPEIVTRLEHYALPHRHYNNPFPYRFIRRTAGNAAVYLCAIQKIL